MAVIIGNIVAPYVTKMNNAFFRSLLKLYYGVFLTSLLGTIAHIIQGLILDNWYGMHPYSRFTNVFICFLISGLLVTPFLMFFRFGGNKILTPVSSFKLGLISGSWCFINLIHPFFRYRFTDFFGVLVILFFIVFYLIYFAEHEKEKGAE